MSDAFEAFVVAVGGFLLGIMWIVLVTVPSIIPIDMQKAQFACQKHGGVVEYQLLPKRVKCADDTIITKKEINIRFK